MPNDSVVTAAFLIIGNEILSGRTQDVNLAYLATTLNQRGVRLREVRVVPDVESVIITAVNELRQRYDYLFTSGGIGPTHDDITTDSVAKAVGKPLHEHPIARQRLETHYRESKLELNAARLRMARTPEGAQLIDNPISSAPGFQVENVMVLAGVPRIFQAMLDSIKDNLQGGMPVLANTIVCNLGEGTLAAELETIQKHFATVDIGSYPRFGAEGGFRLAIVLRHIDAAVLEEATAAVTAAINRHGGTPQVTVGNADPG